MMKARRPRAFGTILVIAAAVTISCSSSGDGESGTGGNGGECASDGACMETCTLDPDCAGGGGSGGAPGGDEGSLAAMRTAACGVGPFSNIHTDLVQWDGGWMISLWFIYSQCVSPGFVAVTSASIRGVPLDVTASQLGGTCPPSADVCPANAQGTELSVDLRPAEATPIPDGLVDGDGSAISTAENAVALTLSVGGEAYDIQLPLEFNDCGQAATAGYCDPGTCVPNCLAEWECGSDSCGGTCGACAATESCLYHLCAEESTCDPGCQVGSVCCGGALCSGDCVGSPCCT